jgi:hypothetical protein
VRDAFGSGGTQDADVRTGCARFDPTVALDGDGDCVCSFADGICEAGDCEGSDSTDSCRNAGGACAWECCPCDPDCEASEACIADGFCDTWCITGADPDCEGTAVEGKYCQYSS